MKKTILATALLAAFAGVPALQAAEAAQPNILVIFGDDIGWQNVSAYGMGTMGYRTPNIDSIGQQGPSLPITTLSRAPRPDAQPSSPVSIRSVRE